MKKLGLDVLEMVVAVDESGSFVQGAHAVHRSPSAVSMQIKSLEQALGKPLFSRNTRNVTTTAEGRTLADYGRRMLAMREQAWASVAKPQIEGRVTIGIPDDYISSLLPQVLGKFAAAHPRVEIRVIGQPSSALVPMLKDSTIDLACLTKARGVAGQHIRFEPIVWVGNARRRIWEERPLPLAVFAHGSAARDHAVRALQRENIRFRMSYESPSFLGLLSMVDAGLAVAPLARCSIPQRLVRLSEDEGLPLLDDVEVVLARSARSGRAPCDYLAEQILTEWGG